MSTEIRAEKTGYGRGKKTREPLPPVAKKAIRGAVLGFTVDFYDIFLPTVALVPIMSYFQGIHLSSTMATTLYYVTFGVTMLARPIGALIFGRIADRRGRKKVTTVSIVGCSTATLLMGLLPGYSSIGALSITLLIVLRFVAGMFLGGSYTSANVLALESAPKSRRGFASGVIHCSMPIAYTTLSLVTVLLLHVMSSKGPTSEYAVIGWRIPFFVGAALGVAFLIYYRAVPESEVWKKDTEKKRTTLADLFVGLNLRRFLQIFTLMTGLWFVSQTVSGMLPGILIQTLGMDSEFVTWGVIVATIFVAVGYMSAAVLSQKFGRRPTMVVCGIIVLIVGATLYAVLVSYSRAGGSPVVVMILAGLVMVLCIPPWGISTVYIIEHFATGVRSSGYALGYSFSVLIPSFSSFYLLGLTTIVPYAYTPSILLAIAGVLTVVGAHFGPETRDVDLATMS